MARHYPLINMLAFQGCWFACVLGGDLIGISSVLVFLLLHLWITRGKGLGFSLLLACAGILFDSLLSLLGVMRFGSDIWPPVPLWLTALWLAFSLTPRYALRWLQGKTLLAAGAGFVFAPVSYFAGQRLEVIDVSSAGYLIIALSWCLTFAAIYRKNDKDVHHAHC